MKGSLSPDAIIASRKAVIELEDSTSPLAVGIYVHAGGQATLDLPVGVPLNRVFGQANTPGVQYRMRLIRHVAPHFCFVFLRRIEMTKPPCDIVLRDCPRVLVHLLEQRATQTPRKGAAPTRQESATQTHIVA
jgi:hypothetical protein